MSITKSFNKRTNTYYAYETTYEWDALKQRKVQRKHCIGKFDPITGEVVPNGKVGRPALREITSPDEPKVNIDNCTIAKHSARLEDLVLRCENLERTVSILSSELHELKTEIEKLIGSME